MRAIRLHGFSQEFDTIQIEEGRRPVPKKGEVLVRMLYSPINPSDHNYIRGDYRRALERLIWNRGSETLYFDPERTNPHPTPPYTLGGEGVGIVVETGSSLLARRLKGKRVALAAGPPIGVWQDYVAVDAKRAIPVPDQLSDQEAAMTIINPLSAVFMVRDVLRVKPGTFLLQSAAGSALAKSVIALSREMGFETVNIVRDGKHIEALAELGARHIVRLDQEDLRDAVARITHGRGVPYAMDPIGGELSAEMVGCLTLGGHLVAFGTLSGPSFELTTRDLMMPEARITGFFLGNHIAQKSPAQMLLTLRYLRKLLGGALGDVVIREVMPLESIHEALKLSRGGGEAGKILLHIGDR